LAQKRCFLQTILQTAVGSVLLQEKTFDIVSVDEKMLLTIENRFTGSPGRVK
jgi:hypothetical protein